MRWRNYILMALLPFTAMANSENDRREMYGNGANNDGAAYVGDQKTKQQLTPRMTAHYTKAQTYFATGNIPMGTMEQMKGDMLKQQINVNGESARKNRESEKLVNEFGDAAENKGGIADTKVITVDQERRLPTQGESSPAGSAPAFSFPEGVAPSAKDLSSLAGTGPAPAADPTALAAPLSAQLAPLREVSGDGGPVDATTELVAPPADPTAEASLASPSGTSGAGAEAANSGNNPWRAITGGILGGAKGPGTAKSALDDDFFKEKKRVKDDPKDRRDRRRRRSPASSR